MALRGVVRLFVILFVILEVTGSYGEELPPAQQEKLDSLHQRLENTRNDTVRLSVYNELCDFYVTVSQFEKAVKAGKKAKGIAKKIGSKKNYATALNNIAESHKYLAQYSKSLSKHKKALKIRQSLKDTQGIGHSYNNIGEIYRLKGDYEKALKNYEQSLKMKDHLSNKKGKAHTYNNMGVTYFRKGDYDKAIVQYQKALKIHESTNQKEGQSDTHINIANIHIRKGNYDKALNYLKKGLKLKKELGAQEGVASCYTNMGVIYDYKKQFKKALKYYQKALRTAQKVNDVKTMTIAYTNIGDIYSKIHHKDTLPSKAMKFKENIRQYGRFALLDSAQYYRKRALNLAQKIGYRTVIVAVSRGMGKDLYDRGLYKKAIAYYRKTMKMADSMGELPRLYKAYEGLARSYEALGRYQQAYDYHVKYAQLRDSVHSRRSSERIAELEEKYEAEKRERKIKMLEKDKKIQRAQLQRNRVMLYSAGGGLLLVLVFSGLLYNRFRVTREQKEVIEHQKEVVEQKNEAIGASIDYARRIQSAILRAESEMESVGRSNYFILFRPKEAVSGDFYWAYRGERDLIWTASDCTGHGVPGAFMSMIGNRLLNEVVIERGVRETGRILDELREGIISTLQQSGEEEEMRDGMDMALCRWYNVDEGGEEQWIEFSGAKNPLYVVGEDIVNREIGVRADRTMGDELIELKGDKQPIGYEGEDHEPFGSQWLKLREGDKLYMFSDGYADQFGGPRGKKFMYKRFKRTLIEIQDKSMPEQGEYLEDKIEDWMAENDEEQLDDICVMGMRIT